MTDLIINLKADHGKFLCAEEGGAAPGTVIPLPNGGNRQGGLLTATRESPGAWETFTVVESDEQDKVGLLSSGGYYACCENNGQDGVIVFRSYSLGAWEKFYVHLNPDDPSKVSFESACRPGFFIKAFPDGHVELAQPMWEGEPSGEPGGYETFISDPPFSSMPGGHNAITGQLRITSRGYEDDNGLYLPIGIHVGDLFSCYCHGRTEDVKSALSKIQQAGYGLVQFWLNLGSLGGDYWAGREIGPEITPDYWGKLREFSDLLDSYGLKGIYCGGDYALRSMSHADFGRAVGEFLIARENKTAALCIAGNEAWQTGADSIDDLLQFTEAFKATGCHVPVTTTSPVTEAADSIAAWCAGDYYNIHGWRDGEDHDRIRHIFSVPWEGNPPERNGYQDEPTGPGDEVSVKASHCYHGRDVDASHLVSLAVISLMTNQGFNYFNSDGVKLTSADSLASWAGFTEVANVVSLVPRDIMDWFKYIHFGDTQPDRVFGPNYGNEVRFDHRFGPNNQIFGVLYGDEGHFGIMNYRAAHVRVRNYKGETISEQDYYPGSLLVGEFIRSQGGQPGQTSYIVDGYLI